MYREKVPFRLQPDLPEAWAGPTGWAAELIVEEMEKDGSSATVGQMR